MSSSPSSPPSIMSSTTQQAPSATTSTPQSTPTPTPATPTTNSPTPTTTPQSSPAQTTPTRAAPAPSGSSASSSSPTPATVSTASSFTSQVATTFATTDPGGSVVYVTSTVPEVITTSVSSDSSHSSPSNTGIIVGAVVGGVAGIIVIALLLFCIRRRVRRDEFDGNFDPDRVVGHIDSGGGTLPNVDLADDVTPFPVNQSYSDQGSASMRQYGKAPYIPSSLGPSAHASSDFYPPGSMGVGASVADAQQRTFMQPGGASPPPGAYAPAINMYGTGPMDWHNPRPSTSPPPSTVSNTTSSARMAKEREAMGRNGQGVGLGLATQPEAAEGSGDVVVHQDAGRAPIEEHVPPREIPPSYDSIRQD